MKVRITVENSNCSWALGSQHTENIGGIPLTLLSCPPPPSPDLPVKGPNSRIPPGMSGPSSKYTLQFLSLPENPSNPKCCAHIASFQRSEIFTPALLILGAIFDLYSQEAARLLLADYNRNAAGYRNDLGVQFQWQSVFSESGSQSSTSTGERMNS